MITKSNDGNFDNLLNMNNLNNEMMSVLLEGDIEEGKEVFQKMTDECDYNSLLCVQTLSHSCFNIDNIFIPFSEKEFIALPVVDKCEALYPDDLIIRARRIGCQAFQFQRQYFEMKLDKEALVEKVNELEIELSAMQFNGSETDEALELTWGTVMTLKLNIASKEEVESIIAEAKDILNKFSKLSMVAATCIQAVSALHTEHLKDQVSHNEVETLYRYVENNPESESVREAISTARYNPMFDSGIPEIDELFNPAYSVAEPFKRSKSKIGRNDPCPCGSGKKFVAEGVLSSFSKDVIISLINKVSYKQLMKQKETQKKVGDLMGGKVLDLDIIKAHDDGIKEGKEEEKVSSLRSMMKNLKMSAEEAMESLDIPKSERSKYMERL